ncbi:MAG: helix-turn-helix domain-containing protein [Planctomycetaceae bacterium]|nr:helix-turn-helix domain-containing protein [Planctomycetaceae bacterium]
MLMNRPDKHAEIELNFFSRGKLTYLFWGERVTVEGGKLALFWAATPHQIVDFEGLDSYFVVTLPLPWVLNWDLPESFTTPILNGRLIQEVEALGPYDEHLFEHWHRDINQNSTAIHEMVLLEVRARLARLSRNLEQNKAAAAGASSAHTARSVGSRDYSKIESMARFIAQNYSDQICLSDIASAVGLHPDYAAYAFKKTFGVTLNNFVIQHRVQHAQRLLVISSKKILEIAFDSGFNSLSRFNTSFKLLCHCTPREYRNSHRLSSSS